MRELAANFNETADHLDVQQQSVDNGQRDEWPLARNLNCSLRRSLCQIRTQNTINAKRQRPGDDRQRKAREIFVASIWRQSALRPEAMETDKMVVGDDDNWRRRSAELELNGRPAGQAGGQCISGRGSVYGQTKMLPIDKGMWACRWLGERTCFVVAGQFTCKLRSRWREEADDRIYVQPAFVMVGRLALEQRCGQLGEKRNAKTLASCRWLNKLILRARLACTAHDDGDMGTSASMSGATRAETRSSVRRVVLLIYACQNPFRCAGPLIFQRRALH
jgi:hypothetical protein